MRVALYYPWLYLTSGAERTILHLSGGSRHEWTLFTHRFEAENTFPGFAARNVVQLGSPVTVRRSFGGAARAALRIARERLPLEGYDALVVVCEGLGDLVLLRNGGIPTLCVCLTPLRAAFDDAYRRWWGSHRGPLQRGAVALGAAGFRAVDRLLWRRYDHVLCISHETQRRAEAGGLRPSGTMEVAPVGLGFDPDPRRSTFGDFFLLPGRIMWTKNVELGIEAFLRFRRTAPEGRRFRLVIAGMVDEKSRPYLARLEAMAGEDAGIEFRRSPSDEELAELYATCYAVLFTAFNEDWGIVPLEAMAFGKPVLATDRGGPRETVLHGVTGYLEPPEPERFARRMAELAAAPGRVADMGAAGPSRARAFSWDRFIDRVDRALEGVAGQVRPPLPAADRPVSLGSPAEAVES